MIDRVRKREIENIMDCEIQRETEGLIMNKMTGYFS